MQAFVAYLLACAIYTDEIMIDWPGTLRIFSDAILTSRNYPVGRRRILDIKQTLK